MKQNAARIHVGMLTYNALSSLRDELLLQTVASIEQAFPNATWHILDNGSTDHSGEALAKLPELRRWFFHRHEGGGHTTPGAGRNRLMRLMAPGESDLVVLSDDDVRWKPGGSLMVRWLWGNAPRDVVLASGLLEPIYPWSEPEGVITIEGDFKVLQRPSVPAAAWTFRARDWLGRLIGPLKETPEGDGEDYDACRRLRARALRLVALDLAEHIGEGYSQLGNDEARKLVGKPLNPKEWGL